MKVALYGGSFNPCHVGHQMTIAYTLATQSVERVYIAPVYKHPDGKNLASFMHRMQMCKMMITMFGERCLVNMVEKYAYDAGGKGLTSNIVKTFLKEYPYVTKVVLVLGSDILNSFQNWEGYSELAQLREEDKIEFFFVGRTGHGVSPVEMPKISSTEIRNLLLSNSKMSDGILSGMLPHEVFEYIKAARLYRT